MKNLKNRNLLNFAFLILFCSCQSRPSFRMTTLVEEELNVIEVDRNRIIQECYFMNAEKENNWRYQYILYLLNEKDEAIPVFYPTNQGKKECESHFKKVEKVLKNQTRVQLCTRNRLEKLNNEILPSDSIPELHDFGSLGKHPSPYHALKFDTICNTSECHSISDTWTFTCPNFKQ